MPETITAEQFKELNKPKKEKMSSPPLWKYKNDAELLIGIDPDVDKSGVGLWHRSTKVLLVYEYTLWDLFTLFEDEGQSNKIHVYLEAGHTDKRTWHKGGNGMAKRVGANNEIGRQIEKFLLAHNIPYRLIKPCGYSSYTHEQFCKLTGHNLKSKTNSEKRVAGLLVYGK